MEQGRSKGNRCQMVVTFICKPTGRTQSSEDVGQLTHGRICENAFDVVGHEGDECSHACGDSTNPSNQHRQIGEIAFEMMLAEEWEHSGHQIETRVHHRCSVDEGRDGSRTFHRVRQPDV